jgi:hypothetical protein
MSDAWQRKKCSMCSSWVFYLASWSTSPKNCTRCRLKEIRNLPALFDLYLTKEKKLQYRVTAHDEKIAFASRATLRSKIAKLLNNYSDAKYELFIAKCALDKDLYSFAFRLAKEQRLNNRRKRAGKSVPAKRIAKFLQGGAPGLGKRS